jgi:prepilin-type N-terminal cleavage/methylation domain-containing protein
MKTSRQAFTLVEIVVAITILAVVMVSVFEIYL